MGSRGAEGKALDQQFGCDGRHALRLYPRVTNMPPIREATMARLCIEAIPSGGLHRYELRLDDNDDDFVGANGKGCVDLPADIRCGDGSTHKLFYLVDGPIGAKLQVKIFCDGVQIRNYSIEVFSPG